MATSTNKRKSTKKVDISRSDAKRYRDLSDQVRDLRSQAAKLEKELAPLKLKMLSEMSKRRDDEFRIGTLTVSVKESAGRVKWAELYANEMGEEAVAEAKAECPTVRKLVVS